MADGVIFDQRFADGRWTGFLDSDGSRSDTPEIGVFLKGRDLGDVTSATDGGSRWKLDFPIPSEVLAEGVTTFVFVDRLTSEPLGRYCIVAGSMAEHDVLTQLDALQSELDLLKSAFRREVRRNRQEP